MERSERTSSGNAAGAIAAPVASHAGRGAGAVADEAGQADAQPPPPEDGQAGDSPGAVTTQVERAGSWQPDAGLMQALGLELDEHAERSEAGDRRPARPATSGEPDDVPTGAPASQPGHRASTSDGKPPWW
jgi:hypothetical protein